MLFIAAVDLRSKEGDEGEEENVKPGREGAITW